MDLTHKTIIVAGGTSGIGYAIAERCAKLGGKVVIVGRELKKTETASAQLQKLSPQSFGITCDLADEEPAKDLATTLVNRLGKVDYFVNSVGYTYYKAFCENTVDEIIHITKSNYLGPLILTKIFADQMVKARSGHVINIGSIASRLPITPSAVYAAAKHAQDAASELLRHEYEPLGVCFSLVLPGRVNTPFFDHESFRTRSQGFENKKMLQPDDIARAVLRVMETRSRIVIMPSRFRVAIYLRNLVPFVFDFLIGKILKRRLRDHYLKVGITKKN